jgi:hypothetical protein
VCNANYLILLCKYGFFIYVQLRSGGITESRNYGFFFKTMSVFLGQRTTDNRLQSISCLMCLFRTTDNRLRTTSFAELRIHGESELRSFFGLRINVYFFKTTSVFCRKSKDEGRKSDSFCHLSQVFCRAKPIAQSL